MWKLIISVITFIHTTCISENSLKKKTCYANDGTLHNYNKHSFKSHKLIICTQLHDLDFVKWVLSSKRKRRKASLYLIYSRMIEGAILKCRTVWVGAGWVMTCRRLSALNVEITTQTWEMGKAVDIRTLIGIFNGLFWRYSEAVLLERGQRDNL